MRRFWTAAFFAAALAAVFLTHVFTAFRPIRVSVIRSAVQPLDGRVRAVVGSGGARDLKAPFAVIWRVRHEAPAAARFSLAIDGLQVCSREVAPGRAVRLDCAMENGWVPAAEEHIVTVDGSATPWSLDYVELATHHGGSAGSRNLVVVPAGSTQFRRPGLILTAGVWLLLTMILLVPPAVPRRRALVLSHRALGWLIVVALALILVAPVLAPYNVIVATDAFVRWMCVLLLWRLLAIGRWLADGTSGRPMAASVGIACLVLVGYSAAMFHGLADYRGNYSGFLHLSKERFENNPLLRDRADIRSSLVLHDNSGYDAQFTYFAVFDPFIRALRSDVTRYRTMADVPPYRFGRIGFTLLTKLVSFDRWQWYPAVMIWLILGALGVSAFVVALLAQRHGAPPAWGAAVLLVPGFWQSLQMGLPEPVAAAFLLTGVLCVLTDRWVAAGLTLALSLLVRETGVFFVVCLAAAAFVTGKRREACVLAITAATPVVLWRLYVGATFQSDFGLQAYFFSPNDLTVPFGGVAALWRRVADGTYHDGSAGLARAAVMYPLLLSSGLCLAVVAAIRRPGPLTIAAVAYGVMAVSFTFPKVWGYVPDADRLTSELFVGLALISLTVPARRRERWSRHAFWLMSAGYVVWGAFDSGFVRSGVLSLVW